MNERYLELYNALKLENDSATALNKLELNDAIAPLYASNFNHQTVPTALSDLSEQTDPAELNQDDDESVNANAVEENWQQMRSHYKKAQQIQLVVQYQSQQASEMEL